MPAQWVTLEFRRQSDRAKARKAAAFKGFSAETVAIGAGCAFDYAWSGGVNYLALHNIKLRDGETEMDTVARLRRLDLRARMTFAPALCRVSGWSSIERSGGYTALTFDPRLLAEERESGPDPLARPLLYFDDPALRGTLEKIQALLAAEPHDLLYLETLVLLAAIELDRMQGGARKLGTRAARLSDRQSRSVREYVEEHLHLQHHMTLSALAQVAGLTRFHFARLFKSTFGITPHQYVLRQRVVRASTMLRSSDLPVADIARLCGFSDPAQFATVFRRLAGCAPTQFRRQHRG